MANMEVTVAGNKEVNHMMTDFQRGLPKNIKKGLTKAGAILELDMKKKVSGPARSGKNARRAAPFSRLREFPGVVTGRHRASIRSMLVRGPGILIGAVVDYAKFLIQGTKKMPSYDYVGPAWQDKGDAAMDAINREVLKPLK